MNSSPPIPHPRGFALLSSMLMLAMLAVFSVGMVYTVQNAMRLSGTDMESGQAYYGASAAMEKMVVDLHNLYASSDVPTATDIQALGVESYRPSLPDVTYPEYSFIVPNTGGTPNVEVRHVSGGSNQGLMAEITPITLDVTALGPGDEAVSMLRNVDIAYIPIFQFSVFSDGDLSVYPSASFEMPGRVHTNGNLFLATGSTSGLIFRSRVTAAKDIIRAELANGIRTDLLSLDKPVKIPTAPRGCEGLRPACRDLLLSEGSKTSGPGSTDNPDWTNLSESLYHGMILNGDTGSKTLKLSFSDGQVRPVDLIRRPPAGEDPSSPVGRLRLFNQAHLRVLLSDNPAELPGGSGVRLANVAPYYDGTRYGGSNTAFAEDDPGGPSDLLIDLLEMLGLGDVGDGDPMIDGYLLVQARNADGTYRDITMEWLDLGIARQNRGPDDILVESGDAILKFQTLKDVDGDGNPEYNNTPPNRRNPAAFSPINLYDTREGEVRDLSVITSTCALGGIVNVIELDLNNLRQWFTGRIRNFNTTGAQVPAAPQGYLLYYSDRRGMRPDGSGNKTGEYGYEDVVNPPVATGQPDGNLDPSEDINGNGVLDTYGSANLGDGFEAPNGDPTFRVDCVTVARTRRVSGARRALYLINGPAGSLPTRADGTGGFTVGSENPVYVFGTYNAGNNAFSSSAVPAAIIADAVTFLSNNWRNHNSFRYPTSRTLRPATTTYYQVAVAAGKNITWRNPSWSSNSNDGLDGGVGHFIRALEDWGVQTLNYRGSLVSPFYSQYAVGTYKCCESVFSLTNFNYSSDTQFLDPAKLPPGTPRVREIVVQGFRQIFTPVTD